jgi:hypothetical protein
VPGLREPLAPDRIDGSTDRRYVRAVKEHSIFLRAYAHPAEVRREIRKIGYLHSGDVVKVALVVLVTGNPERFFTDLMRNVAEVGQKPLPLGRDGLAGLTCVALSQPGNEQRFAVHEARGFEICDERFVHFDGLHEFRCCRERVGREPLRA